MSKHTRGPWRVGNNQFHAYIHSQAGVVAEVFQDDEHCNVEANAQLIAAVPDLLEALKEAFQHLETIYGRNHERGEPHVFKMAREAIAKAEGKNE